MEVEYSLASRLEFKTERCCSAARRLGAQVEGVPRQCMKHTTYLKNHTTLRSLLKRVLVFKRWPNEARTSSQKFEGVPAGCSGDRGLGATQKQVC